MHVLVVDDEAIDLRLTTYVLEHDGHLVEGVTSGGQAIRSIRASRPDVVLSDLMMPGDIDGRMLATLVRSDPDLADLPMIAVTCNGTALTSEQVVLDAGFDAYVRKPIHAAGFAAFVRDVAALVWRER